MNKPYLQHLNSSEDLETTYEAVRAGFVALALEKNRQSTPYIEEARALNSVISKVKIPSNLLDIPDIQSALLTTAGVSDKARKYLLSEDKLDAIKGLIRDFLEPAGKKFIEELIFRFLLIRGDSLGGSMRNIGGVLAQRKLTRSIISTLKISGKSYEWFNAETSRWAQMSANDADVEIFVDGVSWKIGDKNRTMLYNRNVPIVGNNVDLCLFNCNPESLINRQSTKDVTNSPDLYIALGELKGGIDPAGADEHWKTARTALSRIREAFIEAGYRPHTFFIGSAIEAKMASEIWNQLQNNTLENAANLNDNNQLASISHWLCSL